MQGAPAPPSTHNARCPSSSLHSQCKVPQLLPPLTMQGAPAPPSTHNARCPSSSLLTMQGAPAPPSTHNARCPSSSLHSQCKVPQLLPPLTMQGAPAPPSTRNARCPSSSLHSQCKVPQLLPPLAMQGAPAPPSTHNARCPSSSSKVASSSRERVVAELLFFLPWAAATAAAPHSRALWRFMVANIHWQLAPSEWEGLVLWKVERESWSKDDGERFICSTYSSHDKGDILE